MATPSTADSKEAGSRDHPVAEPGSLGAGGTKAAVKGHVAPRMPHERDESSDSGTVVPTDVMHKAAGDVDKGHTDTERGPQTQQHYSELTAKAVAKGKPE